MWQGVLGDDALHADPHGCSCALAQTDQVLDTSDHSLSSLATAILAPVVIGSGVNRIQGDGDSIHPLSQEKPAEIVALQREAIGTHNDLTPGSFEGSDHSAGA